MTVKNNKRMFYCNYSFVGQVIEAVNPSDNIESYVFKEREVKMRRFHYNPTTGEFLGLCDTVGFIVCHGGEEEMFLLYGYDENKSKLLYSFNTHKMPNCFGGTMFSRHRLMFDIGDFECDEFSHIYFFLPSICDRNEEISGECKYPSN